MDHLVGDFWGGFCPECQTPESDMCLNSSDAWECPLCHLQITTIEVVTILPDRGIGHFMKSHSQPVLHSDFAPAQVGMIAQDQRYNIL